MGNGRYRKYGHDLNAILNHCIELDPSFPELSKACEYLNGRWQRSEYDLSKAIFFSVEEAFQCRKYTEIVKDFVGKKLQGMGYVLSDDQPR